MDEYTQVLDHGFVRLDDSMASDLAIVNAARVSLGAHHDTWDDQSDTGLLNFLFREKHASPFEHAVLRFHIKVPIFVARQWMRHRWSSYNELSMRYSKLEDVDFYIPDRANVRTQIGKPGSYKFDMAGIVESLDFIEELESECQQMFANYLTYVERGIAREQARMFLPVNTYTEFYWTVNARSLINFLALRNDSHAQYEINEYAKVLENLFEKELPETYKVFKELGRPNIDSVVI